MDRTIPSFRIATVIEEDEQKSFRISLDRSEHKPQEVDEINEREMTEFPLFFRVGII